MFALILALTLVGDVDPEPPGAKLEVLASSEWSAVGGVGRMEKHTVARSPRELLPYFRLAFSDRKAAEETITANVRAALNVQKIDWDKQMILVVAAGPQGGRAAVEVKGLKVRGKTLTVTWKLIDTGKGGQVKTYPATAILVPMHKGQVVFEQVK